MAPGWYNINEGIKNANIAHCRAGLPITYDPTPCLPSTADRLLLGMAALYFAIEEIPHLLNLDYGYFIDELYFIACSKRLALGYVDHPPLSILLLRLSRTVLGDSLAAIRFLPAVAGAVTVFMTGRIARRLGAGIYGQALAAFMVLTSPLLTLLFNFYSMNAFSVLLWTGCLWVLIEWKLSGNPKMWLWFGFLAGLGFQNKQTIVVLFLCLGLGLLLTEDRKSLLSGWLWAGALLALLIAAPNLWWLIQHDWISLEFYRNAALEKMVHIPPYEVLMLQLAFVNLGGVPVWLAGVFYFLFSRQGKRFRPLALGYIAILLFNMIGGQARPDRMAPFYPVLFAAGGLFWEGFSKTTGRQWMRWALPVVILAPALLLLPLVTPLTPPAEMTDYAQWLGVIPQAESGPGKETALPQWMADRLGWELLAQDVEAVANSLGPDERRQAAILAPSYGHAGALELLGKDLPPVRGTQNNYFLWGRGLGWPQILISIGYGPNSLGQFYESVEQVRIHDCEYCMPWRDNMPIYIARNPIGTANYDEVWERFRNLE